MSLKRKISPFVTISLLLGLFCLAVTGCSQPEPVVPNVSSLSRIQQDYINRHGLPDLFAVNFDPELGRRVDTWVYNGDDNRMLIFDDGFLMEEQIIEGKVADKTKTALQPADFNAKLLKHDITKLFGNPDTQEFTSIQGKQLAILRYAASGKEPVKSFGFVDNELVAVTIGFSFK